MNAPFLTIAIPTWNRCKPLQENVLSLIREIGDTWIEDVEIVISDNASTDETESFCHTLCKKYPFIRYHRNPDNLGANANFQNVIQLARGQYVWLFGDDDLIVENCISKIIHDIRQFHFPDLVIGGAILDTEGERVHLRSIHETTLLNNKKIFSEHSLVDVCGKISVLIFKKSSIEPVLPIAWPIITRLNSPWPHMIWILFIIQKGNILALSYGITYYLSKNWHNLIFDGARLSQILFVDTLKLVKALESHLEPDLYQILMKNTVKLQRSDLVKCTIYATYRNGYVETLREGIRSLFQLPQMKNKMYFFAFYFLPITLPIFIRRFSFEFIYRFFPKWKRYRRLIKNLRESNIISITSTQRTFDEAEL